MRDILEVPLLVVFSVVLDMDLLLLFVESQRTPLKRKVKKSLNKNEWDREFLAEDSIWIQKVYCKCSSNKMYERHTKHRNKKASSSSLYIYSDLPGSVTKDSGCITGTSSTVVLVPVQGTSY